MKLIKWIVGVCAVVSLATGVVWAISLRLAEIKLTPDYPNAASIGIIGSADGPTSIIVAAKISPWGEIALAAAPFFLIVCLALHILEKKR